MKYYIIAGEASGDLHASNLMKHLKKMDQDADFRCWGGDKMQSEGGTIVRHYRDLAFMGFVEVLLNLRTILSNIRFCKDDISRYQPDVIIFVDYPGFNLRIAKFASKAGFKVVYYISPQVWAWKKGRVKQIRRYVDKMLVILPFEKEFYDSHDYEVEFVGHPLLDAIEHVTPGEIAGKPVIALLSGSRKQEISKVLPVMLSVKNNFPEYQFVVSMAPGIEESFYNRFHGLEKKDLWNEGTWKLLSVSQAALVTSGTATLETALMEVPQVVCYKGNTLSYWIARLVVDVKYISLVNLIMDKEVVKELIQADLNTGTLTQELKKILEPEKRQRMIDDFARLKNRLGGPGASEHAAREVISLVRSG